MTTISMRATTAFYTPKEIEVLHTRLPPSNKSLAELVLRGTEYQRIQQLASNELDRDFAQFRKLHAEIGAMADSGKYPLLSQPRTEAEDPQAHLLYFDFDTEEPDMEVIEKALGEIEDHLKNEPKTFEDQFWRWLNSTNGVLIIHEYLIATPLKKARILGSEKNKPDPMLVYLKYCNHLQPYVLGRVDSLPDLPDVDNGSSSGSAVFEHSSFTELITGTQGGSRTTRDAYIESEATAASLLDSSTIPHPPRSSTRCKISGERATVIIDHAPTLQQSNFETSDSEWGDDSKQID
ncbi:hypothetical protein GYMLUDRAFT_60864 [Collybiopsis luxurians FD-317 M1]|uniref:Uncharacterized protein n=1 Tax=Collybiopsis luxurians FD-317 M1 TaxID=944289 RepID=A0A0D0C757_9AGAR|nr:hypothetical protein GYMLUDRAFT_60864 [Collybiopsis luxurians FD-317 M1]